MTDIKPEEEVTFMCCFCGDTCDGKTQVVMVEYDDVNDDDPYVQTWFAHFGCFDSAITPDARVYDQDEVTQ